MSSRALSALYRLSLSCGHQSYILHPQVHKHTWTKSFFPLTYPHTPHTHTCTHTHITFLESFCCSFCSRSERGVLSAFAYTLQYLTPLLQVYSVSPHSMISRHESPAYLCLCTLKYTNTHTHMHTDCSFNRQHAHRLHKKMWRHVLCG